MIKLAAPEIRERTPPTVLSVSNKIPPTTPNTPVARMRKNAVQIMKSSEPPVMSTTNIIDTKIKRPLPIRVKIPPKVRPFLVNSSSTSLI